MYISGMTNSRINVFWEESGLIGVIWGRQLIKQFSVVRYDLQKAQQQLWGIITRRVSEAFSTMGPVRITGVELSTGE